MNVHVLWFILFIRSHNLGNYQNVFLHSFDFMVSLNYRFLSCLNKGYVMLLCYVMLCYAMLYVICYMLYVICYMLYVICYMLYVICYMLYVMSTDVLSWNNIPKNVS